MTGVDRRDLVIRSSIIGNDAFDRTHEWKKPVRLDYQALFRENDPGLRPFTQALLSGSQKIKLKPVLIPK